MEPESSKKPDPRPRLGNKCVFCEVYSNECCRHFHTFPKDPELSDRWANRSGKAYIVAASPDVRARRYRVCSNHFLLEDYTNPGSSRLHGDAVPQPFIAFNQPTINIEVMKDKINASLSNSSLASDVDVTCETPPVILHSTPSTSVPVPLEKYLPDPVLTPSRKRKRDCYEATPKTKKIRALSSKLYYLKRKYSKAPKQGKLQAFLDYVKDLVSPVIYNFIACQIKSSCVNKYGRRWSVKDKNLALQLYLTSPKAYRLFSQHFKMPSKTTLLKCLSGIKLAPGFSDTVLNAIKLVAAKLKSSDKLCVVSFDEMKLKPGLSYDKNKDTIIGYENYGNYKISNPKHAKHALVFMVRGIRMKWKQVFGYFFSSESTPAPVLSSLVNEAISKLMQCGLDPVAVVCDQGPSNQSYYKELNVSVDRPFFFVNNRKIYTLCDPPHLLKCIRNNFKKYNVKFNSKSLSGIAYWEHLVKAYEIDSKLPHRMAPKLTQRHIDVDGLSAMNVSLAAQVLSDSVCSILSYLSFFNVLPATALNTSEFCSNFNKLFDSLNSRVLKHSDKPFLSAVTSNSPHMELWQDMMKFIRSIEFQTEGKKIHFPCIDGWLITLSAFRQMIPELLVKIPYVLMSRFSQDALENFFSVVRRRGGNNDNPTPADFQCRIRMLISEQIIRTCGKANCEPDNDATLVPVEVLTKCAESDFLNNREKRDTSTNVVQHDDDDCVMKEEVDLLSQNAASYVAGYVAKMGLKTYDCNTCKSLLVSDKVFTDNNIFLFFKEYDVVKHGLNVPTDSWLSSVCKFGKIFESSYDKFQLSKNVKFNIVNDIVKIDNSWFTCNTHHHIMWDYLINFYVKLMLFYKVKYKSQSFRNRKRAAKKLKILSA